MKVKLPPAALARKLAFGKALAVAKRHTNAIVIGADTFIVHKKKILGKPGTRARARLMLQSLSGATHTIITGFSIVDSKTKEHIERSVATRVTFRRLSSRQIDEYVETGEPLRAAGGYAIQGGGGLLIKGISGDYNNVAGLPLAKLLLALRKFEEKLYTPRQKRNLDR